MLPIRAFINYINACNGANSRSQTRKEEWANAATHSVGVIFCLVALPILLKNVYDVGRMAHFWAACSFALGMTMVYTSSTLFHATQNKRLRHAFLLSDHISIYFLIAGTYTPLVIRYLAYNDAIFFLSIMWGLVVLGTFFKLFFLKRFEFLSLLLYLCMGWMILFIYHPISRKMPTSVQWWVIGGGICYTVGIYFYVRSSVLYFHSLWHCFVLGGTVAHYISVYKCL